MFHESMQTQDIQAALQSNNGSVQIDWNYVEWMHPLMKTEG